MFPKNKQVITQAEVLRPVQSAPIDARKMLEEMVKQKVAEIMAEREDFVFQPFFNQKKVSEEIRRLQTVPEQRAWSRVFEKRGCIVCRRKDARHCSCACCDTCYYQILRWKRDAIREIEDGPEQFPIRDLEEIAREALFGPPTVPALPAAPDTKRSGKLGRR